MQDLSFQISSCIHVFTEVSKFTFFGSTMSDHRLQGTACTLLGSLHSVHAIPSLDHDSLMATRKPPAASVLADDFAALAELSNAHRPIPGLPPGPQRADLSHTSPPNQKRADAGFSCRQQTASHSQRTVARPTRCAHAVPLDRIPVPVRSAEPNAQQRHLGAAKASVRPSVSVPRIPSQLNFGARVARSIFAISGTSTV